jgi:lysophospholipid acyltransferase (LPLAT)-like uncharacterized protein
MIARFLKETLLPWLLAPIIYLFGQTWRVRVTGDPDSIRRFYNGGESVVYAHWHGDELVLVPFYAYRRLSVLSSLSKDGTLMARTLGLLGYRVFRGSSSRGGARGLLGLIQSVKENGQAALAVDGPRGPIYEVKPGIAELALRTGRPIVAVRVRAEWVWRIPRAWNRSFVPKPFSKVEVIFSAPVKPARLEIESKAAKEIELEKLCLKISDSLESTLPADRSTVHAD